MADHPQSRIPTWAVLWAAIGVLLAFLDRPLWDRIWILTLALWGLYALAGIVLFAVAFRSAIRQGWPRILVTTATAVPLVSITLWFSHAPLARAGDEFQFQRRFRAYQSEYTSISSHLAAQVQLPEQGEIRGISFRTDPGPPVRVAFPQPGGILDNWEAVVYDPTDAVGAVTGWRQGVPGHYSAPPEIVNLFGGALVGCEPVAAHFYRCWFT